MIVGFSAAGLALVGPAQIRSVGPVESHGTDAAPAAADPVRPESEPASPDTLFLISRTDLDGWWINSDLTRPNGESLIRRGLYGQKHLERTLGRRASVAVAPDARGSAWTLPQILRGSGFDAFIAGAVPWNHSIEYPYSEFLWEGNDGSRIFTYRPSLLPDVLDSTSLASEIETRADMRPQSRIVLPAQVDRNEDRSVDMDRVSSMPGIRISNPREAIEAIRQRIPRDSITVWRDALILETDVAFTRSPSGLAKRNRLAEVGLQTAEAVAAIAAGLPGGPAYPRSRLERAWRHVLVNQSRDILSGPGTGTSMSAAHARYDSAAATIDSVVQERFAAIRREMDTRGEGGGAYVLFNPLGHSRVGPALVEIGAPAPDGQVESAARSHSLALLNVPEVPAYGALAIPIGMDGLPGGPASGLASPTGGATWIENAFLRVEIDPVNGAISRILDKSNGRQALRTGGRANVLWVRLDRPAPVDSLGDSGPGDRQEVTRLLSLSSSVTARAATMTILRQWGTSTIRQEVVLGRSAPFVDISSEVSWNEEHRALSVTFEPAVSPDSATWEVPYGTDSHSGRPRAEMDRSDAELPGQRWADVSGHEYGFSILTDSGYGWEYHEGTLQLNLLPARSSTLPDSLVDARRHTFRYALYPHAGDWLTAGTHRLASDYAVPLLAGIEPAHRGRLGKSFSFLSSDHPAVGVEWIKRAEDGEALVVRVVEWGGESAEAEIWSACPDLEAWQANHLEDPGDRLPSSRGSFRIRLRPYEIATVLVECRR